MLLLAFTEAVWYGPATVTFAVQMPGDPFDAKRNDVRVRFIGDRDQREERTAWFDPALGAWKATLFAPKEGQYRAVLVRNGKEIGIDPEEGIIDLLPAPTLGFLTAKASPTARLAFDTGTVWTGLGADIGPNATPKEVDTWATAGANWMRVTPPADPLDLETLARFGATMDEIEKRGLSYSLVIPPTSGTAWRRYVLARFGTSPRLVGWEGTIDDPRARPSLAPTSWEGLFENRPGPFLMGEKDAPSFKALRTVIAKSDWTDWDAPRAWKGKNAKGVGESDRLILFASPGAQLTGLPLVDGPYELVSVDPKTGAVTTEAVKVAQSKVALTISADRFLVLRRR